MRRVFALFVLAILIIVAPLIARADQDSDLDRIPATPSPAPSGASPTPTPAARSGAASKTYLEDAFTQSLLRESLVPYPPPLPAQWENLTSVDTVDDWALSKRLSFNFSDRFNVVESDRFALSSNQAVRNDLREGYFSDQFGARTYLEIGRINIRNGVALGFNPTDFFKTGTLVEQSSLDPSVIREDRLGTFMVHLQTLWDRGSADVSFAPQLSAPTPISAIPRSGLDPEIGKTNAADRFEFSLNYNIADFSPQALVYTENGRTDYGLNVSHEFGQRIVGYAEWAGGRQPDLIASAIEYGKATGTLPANAPLLPPTNPAEQFRNDLAMGASLTSFDTTLNIEYHYHQAGFSADDWQRWFGLGQSPGAPRALTGELWFIRGFANNQQEPLTQQQIFVRIDRPNAFVSDLELSAFAFVDLHDGSTLSQIAATYALSSKWSIAAYLSANVGSPRSERGSFPQAGSAIVQVVRYL